jgi:hypothetical protein
MELKPISAALAVIFGTGGLLVASGARADSMTGSLTVTGPPPSTQTAPGPSFNLTTNQLFFTSLSPGYSGYATGDLASGIMSLQAVTGGIVSPPGDGLATVTYTTTITNSGSAAQAYTFNYYINGGTLISDPVFGFGSGPGSVTAQFGATVSLNGTSTQLYGATLVGSATGAYVGESFQVTNMTGSAYSTTPIQGNLGEMATFGPLQGSFALGTLAAGQSEVLTYTLTGMTTTALPNGHLDYYGGGIAQLGDPNSVQGQGLTTFGVSPVGGAVSAVPEPSTNVILGTGALLLAGLALRRRRTAALGASFA